VNGICPSRSPLQSMAFHCCWLTVPTIQAPLSFIRQSNWTVALVLRSAHGAIRHIRIYSPDSRPQKKSNYPRALDSWIFFELQIWRIGRMRRITNGSTPSLLSRRRGSIAVDFGRQLALEIHEIAAE
jgi:hypothetical protein